VSQCSQAGPTGIGISTEKRLALSHQQTIGDLTPIKGGRMTDGKFLTAEEVSERYRGGVSVGTLRNWRAMKIGPSFVKIGKAVLYPIVELEAWDETNKIRCRASRRLTGSDGDQV